jgi:hypothetical protein
LISIPALLPRLLIVFTILRLGSACLLAQTFVESSEMERLKTENKELRKKLADAEQKLKAASPKATPTPAPATPSSTVTTTEPTVERTQISTFFDKVFLRKSVFSEDTLSPAGISGPAQFTFEHPGHGNDSYSIDTGVAVTFITAAISQAQIDWGVGLDYHRNSAASSPKDLFQTGVVADSIFGNPATSDFFARLKANLSYKDDELKDLQSVAGGIDVLPVARLLWIDNYHVIGPAHWRWQPFAGLRWESSTGVASGASNGYELLARYGIESQVFPFFECRDWFGAAGSQDKIKRSIEVTLTLTAWSDIASSGVYNNKDWRGYLDANLTYWFGGGLSVAKEKASLGFGLGYQNGDNPDLNRTDVDLLTLSLKAKF